MIVRVLFIVNPVAGNGKAIREWESVSVILKKKFSNYDVIFTERPGHATEIARKASSEGYEIVAACGGDGTLNEVINGLVETGIKAAFVPLGTGSDFGKTIGVRDVETSIETLLEGKSKKMDVGRATFDDSGESRFFMNVLEIGFGARVMEYVNSHEKGGRYTFILGVFSVLRKLKAFNVTLETDGKSETKTIEIIVANGKYFGGGMLASPASSTDDGLLDLHILKPVSRLTTIFRLRNLMNGSYIEKGFSLESRITSARFQEKGILVEMDGEVVGKTPVSVSVVNEAINFIIP